jgi:DivIVA domain-containing protein
MHENDRRQRVISSTPHLSPEEVATRSFGTKVRGYSEAEVRGFLKRVAEQMAHTRDRQDELESALDSLEEQLRNPRPLSEQELLDALGEETARLLRSAREASDDIRTKAEERAARLVEEAQDAADRMRAEAEEVLSIRTAQADARSAELIAEAEGHAQRLRELATGEAENTIEGAREQGRHMLDDAKAARERVLVDLVRRRALLQAQIIELRGGRDNLLDAYRTVKRTFLDATEALVQVEARAATERATAEPLDIAAEIAAEIEALDAADVAQQPEVSEQTQIIDVTVEESVEIVIDPGADDSDEDAATKLADVDSLFARLRAGHEDLEPESAAAPAGPTPDVLVLDEVEDAVEMPESAAGPAAEGRVDAKEWLTKRNRSVDPLLSSVVKRAKRTAQDDQNALLDAVRRFKGRPHADQVLPAVDASLEKWTNVVRDAIDRAYNAGRTATGAATAGAGEPAPAELTRESVIALVDPIRDRLTTAIDAGDTGDTGGLVERIGARYREWKNQSLEPTLHELLGAAWARGVYDAVPDGATLWWVPAEEGQCSDCDDNALEPTVKGKSFPTGQPFPPAHPGCKCLLAPAAVLTSPTV